ncbi:conjugative transfer signal peptidase TraF [Maritalea sp.]|uniref:conjugative transfer signal peptidase TraF n=1 Tax=Maritalea sp. TaxID=2003361 RepID=UPI003EF2EB21
MDKGRAESVSLFIVMIVSNAALIVALLMLFGVRVNLTPSFPIGLYKKQVGGWDKFDLVMSCIPNESAKLAVERGYLANSTNCNGHTPVIKRVMAVEGDYVEVKDMVYVNGTPVKNTTLSKLDSSGRKLIPAVGELTDSRHVWLLSDHLQASFDSRYFGSVDRSLVMFKVVPIWTF